MYSTFFLRAVKKFVSFFYEKKTYYFVWTCECGLKFDSEFEAEAYIEHKLKSNHKEYSKVKRLKK